MAKIIPFGDEALIVTFGKEPSVFLSERIHHFCFLLEKENIEAVKEWVPTYLSVTIYYDPYVKTFEKMKSIIEEIIAKTENEPLNISRTVFLPVCYERFGIDLEEVANYHQLTVEEVIDYHLQPKYFVHMLGFSPGFPYLGGLNRKIATPRKKTPRMKVLAGSVGIAGEQTGVYTIDSPGGWQIIGRTPVPLYDPRKEPPVLLRPFDYVKFEKITFQEYEKISNDIFHNKYEVKIEWGTKK